jgi:PAS domain S-box-containing protein
MERAKPTIDIVVDLAARTLHAPAQLVLFEGPRTGAIATDPCAPDLTALAREVVAQQRRLWDLRPFGAETAQVVGCPVISGGRPIGALCLFGADATDDVERGLSDYCLIVGRECERLMSAGQTRETSGDEIPPALLDIMNNAPVAMALYDRDLRILKCNDRYGFDFNVNPQRLVGRHLFDLNPPLKQAEALFQNCLKGERINSDRTPFKRRNGEMGFLSTVTIPWRTTNGEVGGLLGMYRLADETSGHGDDYEFARIKRRLEAAIKQAGIRVWEIDFKTKAMWGMGGEEAFAGGGAGFRALAKDPGASIHPEDRAKVVAEIAKTRTERRPYRGEYRINHPEKEIWVQGTAADYYDDNGELATRLGVWVDITQRKEAEKALVKAVAEAEAANRAKSDFLATISHEIRTPLNGVLGMAAAMSADELSAVQRERLEIVRQSGETLLSLLNDVLDLSKMEAGKLVMEGAPFDLGEVVGSAYAAFRGVAETKGLALELKVEEAAKGTYLGDAVRVRQIISNLVSNAMKFTEKGRASIEVAAADPGFVVTIRDTGIGIPKDRLDKLFNKFEQADSSTTRRYGGTGLGLAICRELAELMGGRVDVESQEGVGTTFRVTFPLEKTSDEAVRRDAPDACAPTSEIDAESLRVLAAEDNKVNQVVLRTLLNQVGVDPMIVEDGQAAVEAWELGDWDVILMDVQMPVMDGPTATRTIREREAESGRAFTPIIALTANVMAHQVRDYEAAGMNGCVAKPIEVSRLFAALETALAMKAEPQEAPAAALRA